MRMTPTFLRFNLRLSFLCTLAISLTGKSNLLEFLCFCLEDCLSESTLKQWWRGSLLRREGKNHLWLSRGLFVQVYKLMTCLLPKHSLVAKVYKMWLITALELWLTGAHCQHIHGNGEVCGIAAARYSNSRVPFCCLTNDFGITTCSSGWLHFFFESFRNVVFVENKMGNDGLKVDRDIRSNCEPA